MSSTTGLQKRNWGFYGSWRARGRRVAQTCALLALLGSVTGCVTTPVTGRRALNGFSIAQDNSYGDKAYDEVIASSKLKDGGPEYAMTKRCADRLIAVADDPGFEWEVHVIDDPATVNAWCMPGGKMAVYTGILPVTADETGLAVVMAHEIGHAVARHGTERLTMEMGPNIAIELLGGENKALLAAAQQYAVSMPWGRRHELEADHIGLIYMARAGYDPRKAVEFWQRMSEQSQGAPPEFLSTHPADSTRIAQLQQLLPEAMQIWQANAAGATKP